MTRQANFPAVVAAAQPVPFIDFMLSEPADLCASSGILCSSPSSGWGKEDAVLVFPFSPASGCRLQAGPRPTESSTVGCSASPGKEIHLFIVDFVYMITFTDTYQTDVFLIGSKNSSSVLIFTLPD